MVSQLGSTMSTDRHEGKAELEKDLKGIIKRYISMNVRVLFKKNFTALEELIMFVL